MVISLSILSFAQHIWHLSRMVRLFVIYQGFQWCEGSRTSKWMWHALLYLIHKQLVAKWLIDWLINRRRYCSCCCKSIADKLPQTTSHQRNNSSQPFPRGTQKIILPVQFIIYHLGRMTNVCVRKLVLDWLRQWASYQIRKFRVAHAPGMPEKVSPATDFKGTGQLAIPACITARASRTCRDACRDPLPAVAGKKVPDIPDACTTHTCTYLVRGPWRVT